MLLRTLIAFFAGTAIAAAAPLTAERVLPAMQQALGETSADIEIIEISHFPAPDGAIEFSLKDLTPPASPNAPSRWRGYVRQDTGHRFSVWAMVRITAECRRVIATEQLTVGQPILAGQVREETYVGFPIGAKASVTLAGIVGRAPLRTIREGATVQLEATIEPILISGGSDVIAEFHSGRFRITAPVVALGSGRLGDKISVRNTSSKKIFGARVVGPGHVVVEMAQ